MRLRRPLAEHLGGGGILLLLCSSKGPHDKEVLSPFSATVKQETGEGPEVPMAAGVATIMAAGGQPQGVARPHLGGDGVAEGSGQQGGCGGRGTAGIHVADECSLRRDSGLRQPPQPLP